jgi:tRNA pseudouridine(38-40) synthase
VGVSIDGPRDLNDGSRGLEGGFDAALAGLRHARDAGMRTGVRITLTRRNVDVVEDVAEIAAEVGAGRFYVSHLVYAGRGLRMVKDDLDPAASRGAMLALFAINSKVEGAGQVIHISQADRALGILPFFHSFGYMLLWFYARHNTGIVFHPSPLDVAAMRKAAAMLEGEHDFAAFTANPNREVNGTVRNLSRLKVSKKGHEITITARSNGFLYKMVRLLTGAAIHAAQGRLRLDDLKALLDQPRGLPWGKSPLCAPPDGLFLERVHY